MINRRLILGGLLAVLCTPRYAPGQQSSKVYRIAYLSPAQSYNPIDLAFEESIAARGYEPGRNLSIQRQYTNGQARRLSTAAAELVRLRPDCIVVWTTAGAVAVRDATNSIPVVFLMGNDPIRAGLIKSLARPGGNVTGVSGDADEQMTSKRLQLFKEMIPGLSRVMVLSRFKLREYVPGKTWKEPFRVERARRRTGCLCCAVESLTPVVER